MGTWPWASLLGGFKYKGPDFQQGAPDSTKQFVRPEKWDGSQVGFRGSNACGGRIVLLPGAFWAHGASKMATFGASLLLCVLQCFRVQEGMLPPGACCTSRASARRLCASSLCPQIPYLGVQKLTRSGLDGVSERDF